MRQAAPIEAISSAEEVSLNIGEIFLFCKAFFRSYSNFVNYVKILCKQYYVNLVLVLKAGKVFSSLSGKI